MDVTALFAAHVSRHAPVHYAAGASARHAKALNDPLDTAASAIVRQHQALADYVRISTWLIGILPIAYGGMTWIFGDDLWSSSPIYRTALSVPYAPQSWGTTFIVLGVLSILLAELRYYAMDAVCCMAMAVILASFMVAFMAEAIGHHLIGALPPATIYALFSLLFMIRARLSWKFRRQR